jgi:hypothetical protein
MNEYKCSSSHVNRDQSITLNVFDKMLEPNRKGVGLEATKKHFKKYLFFLPVVGGT